MKNCRIHDVLRDLCIRESLKENFICATRVNSLDSIPQGIESKRRLAIDNSTSGLDYQHRVIKALRSASFARSFVCELKWYSSFIVPSLNLLRVMDVPEDKYTSEMITKLSSLRYQYFKYDDKGSSELYLLMFLHWNFQTFKCDYAFHNDDFPPPPIWEMTELRHLQVYSITLPDPPESDDGKQNFYVLENLQTLQVIMNFRCTEQVVKRIPNLRKLQILYDLLSSGVEWSYYCLNNLVHLHKLESLTLLMHDKFSATNVIAFPRSLKRLELGGCRLPWEDIKIVGSLPELEVLILSNNAFEGPRWEATDGEFVRLKYLLVDSNNLKYWTVEKTNFPMLEYMYLICPELEEIPFGFTDIPTLQRMQLREWNPAVITSAREILEGRDNLGYDGLHVDYYNEEEECWTRIEIDQD